MSGQAFRYCPHCEQRVPVTDEWKLYMHYVDRALCPGSREPVEQPKAAQNRHGSRWR